MVAAHWPPGLEICCNVPKKKKEHTDEEDPDQHLAFLPCFSFLLPIKTLCDP